MVNYATCLTLPAQSVFIGVLKLRVMGRIVHQLWDYKLSFERLLLQSIPDFRVLWALR